MDSFATFTLLVIGFFAKEHLQKIMETVNPLTLYGWRSEVASIAFMVAVVVQILWAIWR